MKIFNRNINFFLILIISYGIFIRFFNLSWGTPFFFHPDERNIASSVSQLLFPLELNPHFFAYGTFPIYVNYFTGVFSNLISLKFASIFSVSFEQAIIIGRFYSAIFSVLCIFLIHKIFKLITRKSSFFLVLILSTSVGFIQFAHFATFEMWLTLFSLLLFYSIILYYKNPAKKNLILAAVSLGLLISIKISSVVLFPITICAILFINLSAKKEKKITFIKISKDIILLILTSSLCYILTSPYSILDYKSFMPSVNYESGVALGTLPVFYTGSFYNTVPVLFQFLLVFPFLVNPFITLLSVPALIFICYKTLKSKNFYYLLTLVFFFTQLLSQTFLFAKWTRYMVPVLPFMYLLIFFAFYHLADALKKIQKPNWFSLNIFLITLSSLSFIYSFAFTVTVFVKPDTRLEALDFAKKNIPSSSKILSEVYDLGIVPFNSNFSEILLFNSYDLDSASNKQIELNQTLNNNEYIILPSQRIINSRIINADKFPIGNRFYSDLISDKLSYKQIYKTPCNVLCKIVYMGDPAFNVELTANVFDRPSVFIFKKIR